MSEPITGELRDAMERYCNFKNENIVKLSEREFESRCDAIDSIHANLERENDRLKCELDRVLGELDGMHKTEGISDNSRSFMHEVSITDELREYFGKSKGMFTDHVLAIADRIDAEHQRQLDVLYRDMIDAEWVRLPKDADGEYIHIGDVMEWSDGSTCEVVGIGDGGTLYYMDEMEGTIGWTNADGKRHHHAPTVEDVLEEYRVRYYDLLADMECKNITNDEYAQGIKSLNAEYASRFCLAGDSK